MNQQQSQYLIVGGSAAGMAAAHAIREQDPRGTITVLSGEPDAPYFRPLIPFLVAGKKTPAEMAMTGCGPYTGANIVVQTGARVASVDPLAHCVSLEDGTHHGYEKVLFTTGSRPYVPPDIEGTDAEGVFALRTLADARRMAARLHQTEHAVMLGGGLLNLKAAFALLEQGVKVTLVIYSPEVLSQLMEPGDATLIRKALDKAGLAIMTGVAATGIMADASGVTGAALDNGSTLACQMVCIGKGVRPNVEFLTGSGRGGGRGHRGRPLYWRQPAGHLHGWRCSRDARTDIGHPHHDGPVDQRRGNGPLRRPEHGGGQDGLYRHLRHPERHPGGRRALCRHGRGAHHGQRL